MHGNLPQTAALGIKSVTISQFPTCLVRSLSTYILAFWLLVNILLVHRDWIRDVRNFSVTEKSKILF